MRRFVAGLAMLVGMAGTAGAQTVTYGPNLIVNGGFEPDLPMRWGIGETPCPTANPYGSVCWWDFTWINTVDPINEEAYVPDGLGAYTIEAQGVIAYITQDVPVVAGQRYLFTAAFGGDYYNFGQGNCTTSLCTATATGLTTIEVGFNTIDAPHYERVYLDDLSLVQVTTTAPEPSSLALLSTGLVGLVPIVRRRLS